MYVNDRDEINYHKFLKSMRKSQHVSLEQVVLGIYKKSAMSRIESGERLPDKLVRDRLTARLGISGEEYEEYLLPREYKQWECRMDIIRCINKKDITSAEEKIAAYAKEYNANHVDIQFALVMQFIVMEMKGCSKEELYKKICEAMDCTIVDAEAALDGLHLLADQELNLIMEYVRLRKEVVPENDLTEWKLKIYDKIANYVAKSQMDKIAQAKVYSKLACFVSELVLTEYTNEEGLYYSLNLCSFALEILRDAVRLYYFVELNEYRMRLIEALIAISIKDATNELMEMHKHSKEWAELLNKMYVENDLSSYMQNDTHLYTETECNNVCQVIRIRRAMMGLSREKFCGFACEPRTLCRIEKEEENPTMATVRDFLERCGICAEYKRARVVTSNVYALILAERLMLEINMGKHMKALETHKELSDRLDLDIVFNEQEMRRLEAINLRKLDMITEDEHRKMLIDILECTLSLEAVKNDSEKYFTLSELSCVHDFEKYTNGDESEVCWQYIKELCFGILKFEEIEVSRLHTYEFLMSRCANHLGNCGMHKESIDISRKLLKESLRNRRMFFLLECEYNILWNCQKLIEKDGRFINNDMYYASLCKGLSLSILARRDDWKNFFQRKIKENE